MIIAITGHRPDKLGGYIIPNPIYNAVVEGLDRAFMEFKPDSIITGMALGVDQWAAEVCIYNDIPFEAAIPFEGFDAKWPEASREIYRYLMQRARKIHVISPPGYEPRKMYTRNRWMVDHADMVVAVYNGTDGGTQSTVDYAIGHGKPLHIVPLSREIWHASKAIQDALVTRRDAWKQSQERAARESNEAATRIRELERVNRQLMEEVSNQENALASAISLIANPGILRTAIEDKKPEESPVHRVEFRRVLDLEDKDKEKP